MENGKPKPIQYLYKTETVTLADTTYTVKWETFTKLTVNMKEGNQDGIVKISGLNPDYVYRIEEDAWAHLGYTFDPNATAQHTMQWNDTAGEYKSLQNPFVFSNTPKGNVYAEDIVRNVFSAGSSSSSGGSGD